MYLAISVILVLAVLLVASARKCNYKHEESEYAHAVKRLFKNNPEIRDKMKDKIKL